MPRTTYTCAFWRYVVLRTYVSAVEWLCPHTKISSQRFLMPQDHRNAGNNGYVPISSHINLSQSMGDLYDKGNRGEKMSGGKFKFSRISYPIRQHIMNQIQHVWRVVYDEYITEKPTAYDLSHDVQPLACHLGLLPIVLSYRGQVG